MISFKALRDCTSLACLTWKASSSALLASVMISSLSLSPSMSFWSLATSSVKSLMSLFNWVIWLMVDVSSLDIDSNSLS